MQKNAKKGFTITELVIVIVVIAILAAVMLPAFAGMIDKANAGKALQEARNALTLVLADQKDGALASGTDLQVEDRYFAYTGGQLTAVEGVPDLFEAYATATVDGSGVIVYLQTADGIAGAFNASNGITYAVFGNGGPEIDPNDSAVPTYTYSQVNEPVQKFLSEVSYENVADNVSYIADYATAGRVHDKPVGCTVELQAGELTVYDNSSRNSYTVTVPAGPYTFYNITPGVGGEFWVKNGEEIVQKGHLRPTGTLRMIYYTTSGLQNIRDLGGLACDGGTIKYNKIIRGGQVIDATGNDRNTWVKLLGIDLDIFVKTYSDSQLQNKEQYRTQSPLGDTVALYQMDLSQAENTDNMRTYATAKEQMKGIMNRLFDNAIAGGTTYFHCLAGADRTGMVAILTEGVLGVSKSDIDKDYELTSFSTATIDNATGQIKPNTLRSRAGIAYNYNILRQYGGASFRDMCVNYLLECGVSLEKINAFRNAVIDGNPEQLTVPEPETELTPSAESVNFCMPNGDGWIDGGRCSSTGADRTDSPSYTLTNYFAVQNGDVVYVKNLDISTTLYSGIYNANKTGTGFVMASPEVAERVTSVDLSGEWEQFTINYANAGYMRLCGIIPEGKTAADIVINIQRGSQWLTADN